MTTSLGTPILETSFKQPDEFSGIDILRAIRSSDPCTPCTTHVMVEGRTTSSRAR
jgi:hydrogenase large subunit